MIDFEKYLNGEIAHAMHLHREYQKIEIERAAFKEEAYAANGKAAHSWDMVAMLRNIKEIYTNNITDGFMLVITIEKNSKFRIKEFSTEGTKRLYLTKFQALPYTVELSKETDYRYECPALKTVPEVGKTYRVNGHWMDYGHDGNVVFNLTAFIDI